MSHGHPSAAIPRSLGRYEILAPIARGGMGQVWVGRLRGARGFNKLVAIKTLLPLEGSEGRLETMLLEEARIAALIHHANVVQTLELGEHESTLYLVMEWVDGESLSLIFNRAQEGGGIPLAIAVHWIAQTLRGLHAAHELTDETGRSLGVVHRDVSPPNVLVTYLGVAKLMDFGIAKATNQDSSSTQTGEVKGKVSYMAPEQIRCEFVDRRADIFSMGIMLYLLTTGRHPFKSENPAGVLHKITSEEPAPRPSLLFPGYSSTLEAIVMKALQKLPENRWQNAQEMLGALERVVPQAFAPGLETQIMEFMTALVGDRAAQRREIVYRAQIAADSRSSQSSGGHLALSLGSAQSASSLRALSVDQGPQRGEPVLAPAERATPPAAPDRRRRAPVGAAIGAAVLLAASLFLLGGLRSGTAVHAGFQSAGRMERYPPAPSAPPHPPAGQRQAPFLATSARTVVPTGPVGVPSASAPGSSTGLGAPAALPSTSTPATPAARPRSRSKSAKNRDLIAPDYAR